MSAKPNRYWVFGRVHPVETRKPEELHPSDDFTIDEITKLNMTNIPFVLEHHDDRPIGKIVMDMNGPNGAKYALKYIDLNGPLGRYAKSLIENGTDLELSIKHKCQLYGTVEKITRREKIPIHIGLLEKSRFNPTCRILWSCSEEDVQRKIIDGKVSFCSLIPIKKREYIDTHTTSIIFSVFCTRGDILYYYRVDTLFVFACEIDCVVLL
jgi:hypothetical protein